MPVILRVHVILSKAKDLMHHHSQLHLWL